MIILLTFGFDLDLTNVVILDLNPRSDGELVLLLLELLVLLLLVLLSSLLS